MLFAWASVIFLAQGVSILMRMKKKTEAMSCILSCGVLFLYNVCKLKKKNIGKVL